MGVSASQQVLYFSGLPLLSHRQLKDYGLHEGSLVKMELGLLGGAPEKKRKVSMICFWRYVCCFNPSLVRLQEEQDQIKTERKKKEKKEQEKSAT